MQERLRELREVRARVAEQADQMELLSQASESAQQTLRKEALEMEARIGELQVAQKRRDQQLDGQALELEQAREVLEQQQSRLADQESQLADAAQNLQKVSSQAAVADAKVVELTARLASAEELAEQRAGRISALAAERDDHGRSFQEAQASLTEQSSTLAELRRELEQAREQIGRGIPDSAREELERELHEARSQLDKLQWAQKQASMYKAAKERAEQHVTELKLDVEHWQQRATCVEVNESRLHRQDEDLKMLRQDYEELREQSRELSLTVQRFRGESEHLEAENRELRGQMEYFEMSLERAVDQNAQLIGHSNQKQKIRYTMRLKEDNNVLRGELKQARQRIAQLEVTRAGEGMLDMLCDRDLPEREPRTPKRSAGSVATRTPSRTARTPRAARGAGTFEAQLADSERRCHIQECALERISVNFQHLRDLVERAICPGRSASLPELLEQLRARPARGQQPRVEPHTPELPEQAHFDPPDRQ
mmetsp:Transcript_28775/g.62770  ORF Transcript_28775/g.62770 Transcript_28775/m.62770 type:complete len:484 (+) Transcript_28775:1-1452(+)